MSILKHDPLPTLLTQHITTMADDMRISSASAPTERSDGNACNCGAKQATQPARLTSVDLSRLPEQEQECSPDSYTCLAQLGTAIPAVWCACPERQAEFVALVQWLVQFLDERERQRLAFEWRPLLGGLQTSR